MEILDSICGQRGHIVTLSLWSLFCLPVVKFWIHAYRRRRRTAFLSVSIYFPLRSRGPIISGTARDRSPTRGRWYPYRAWRSPCGERHDQIEDRSGPAGRDGRATD